MLYNAKQEPVTGLQYARTVLFDLKDDLLEWHRTIAVDNILQICPSQVWTNRKSFTYHKREQRKINMVSFIGKMLVTNSNTSHRSEISMSKFLECEVALKLTYWSYIPRKSGSW